MAHRRRLLTIVIGLALYFSACADSGREGEELAVYDVTIRQTMKQVYGDVPSVEKSIFVINQTAWVSNPNSEIAWMLLANGLAGMKTKPPPEVVDEFLQRNRQPKLFNSQPKIKSTAGFVNPHETMGGPQQSVVTVSGIGFDSSIHHALVYATVRCGNLCGWVGYLYLIKEAGHWRVRDVSTVWYF